MKDKHYSKDFWRIKNTEKELNALRSNPKITNVLHTIRNKYLITEDSFSFLTYGGQGVLYIGFSSVFETVVCIKVPFYNSYEQDNKKELDLLEEAEKITLLPSCEYEYYAQLLSYDHTGRFLIKKYYDYPELNDLILNNEIEHAVLIESLINHYRWLVKSYKESLNEVVILCDYKALNLLFNTRQMIPMIVDLGNVKTCDDIHLDRLAIHKKIGSRKFLHWPPELLIGEASCCGNKCNEFILGTLLYYSIMHSYPFLNDEDLSTPDLYNKYNFEYNEAYRCIKESPKFKVLSASQRDVIAGCINPRYNDRLALL